jgi:hypothetical protein
METDTWRPLCERETGVTGERPLVEGVPDYLLDPLQRWVERAFRSVPRLSTDVFVTLRRPKPSSGHPQVSFVPNLQGDELLDVVDAILHLQEYLLEAGPVDYKTQERLDA